MDNKINRDPHRKLRTEKQQLQTEYAQKWYLTRLTTQQFCSHIVSLYRSWSQCLFCLLVCISEVENKQDKGTLMIWQSTHCHSN
jgi:hypothetical protein